MSYNRWHANPTQIYWVCKAFCEGKTLTHETTIQHVNSWRLASIVNILRDKFHWPIESDYRGAANIKHYWLRQGVDKRELQLPPSARHLFEGEKR